MPRCRPQHRSDADESTLAVQARPCRVLPLPQADPLAGAKSLAPFSSMWHTMSMDATVVLGQQGRLVIPADVRSALGLAPGDRLHLHVAGQRLVLARQQDAVGELRGLASAVPEERSLVDELLAERRLAAAAE